MTIRYSLLAVALAAGSAKALSTIALARVPYNSLQTTNSLKELETIAPPSN